jgi:hypothetical protein
MSSSVKQQVIQDMQLAGLAAGTQRTYLDHIVRFVRHTRIRPQDATEAQVEEYLRELIQRGLGQGTLRPVKGALQFIFQNTLNRPWELFKKESPPRGGCVCPRPPATSSAAACWPPSASRCIAPVWP